MSHFKHRYGANCAVQLQHPGRQAALPRNLHTAVQEGAGLGQVLDEHKFFNPNNTFIDELSIDIAGQLTR